MSIITFDTDELIQRLIAAKVEPEQARAIVRVIADAQKELATKSDILSLEQKLQALEYRMVIKLGSISAASIAIAVAIVQMISK